MGFHAIALVAASLGAVLPGVVVMATLALFGAVGVGRLWGTGRLSWSGSDPSGTRSAGAEPALARLEEQLARIEADRRVLEGGLTEQLRLLQAGQELMRSETGRLVRALRDPVSRGHWGELQLRRVLELAGMVAHCDFVEQPGLEGVDGPLRPDLVVHLPGGRCLAVDAKVPLRGWLESTEATDDSLRRHSLAGHARQLRAHVSALGAKEYWAALPNSPEVVVAFLPAEALLASALEADPSLLEFAVSRKVLLATPVTLIAMLRAVSFGWQQESLVDNARLVAEQGRELHRRLSVFTEHLAGLGRHLDRAVISFNDSVGSLESRVLVSARRLAELGALEDVVVAPSAVPGQTRGLRSQFDPGEAEPGRASTVSSEWGS